MQRDSSFKNYSFISEGSFCASTAWGGRTSPPSDKVHSVDKASRDERALSKAPTDNLDDVQSLSPRSRATTEAFDMGHPHAPGTALEGPFMASEGPPLGARASSSPASMELLQEILLASGRHRAVTAPPAGFFNHLLYGSLRTGALVDLFSQPYCGLAISAAATGFMVPFLTNAFQPLLCVYLSFNANQCTATLQLIKLPGVLSFFIGLVSDFYPIRNFHRKFYILGGWVFAYLALMALVIVTLIDDRADVASASARTFYGGTVYVVLMMAASFGVSVVAITAFALIVELSQREPIHERGKLFLDYLLTFQVATLLANIMIAFVVNYDDTSHMTQARMSMKVIVLIMAVIALVPIPAVLFRLDEEPRQLKVDSVDRSSLTRRLWKIIQQQVVWRIVAFICCSSFFASFRFTFVDDAVFYWAHVTPDTVRVGEIPKHLVMIGALLLFQHTMFNSSWIRVSAGGLVIAVGVDLLAAVPTIFNGIRSAYYIMSITSFVGITRASIMLVTSLPVVEITEPCLEGAMIGLVSSYAVLISMTVATFSDAISRACPHLQRDFVHSVIAHDTAATRVQVFLFVLGNCAIHLLALFPIVYLSPSQKLEAQRMRNYGRFSRPAGIVIAVLFVGLVAYAGIVNVLALLKYTSV
ncbi:hypothetical protein PsorP6_006485 [Peronosclerospora sorghi]|uniref:Uncharacterized protein n=1 Tax=Peronosclerospora sorghi TaxID=230839 RepID=A0ACC0W676_9STRA|nr:hypothetical protein PsorP6_006485 [Peronosclerospora sorghi]